MAKKIIITGAAVQGTNVNVTAVYWYPITSGALAQASGSLWSGASGAENTSIQNGSVLEEQLTMTFPLGIAGPTIEALLLLQWTNRNAQLAGKGPATFAGVFNDSVSGWSA